MEIKDYPLITTIADNDLLLVQTANDGAFKGIKGIDLKKDLSGIAPINNTILTYVSPGDLNGICYWLGAKGGSWANPHTSGMLEVSASSLQAGSLAKIVDMMGGIPMFTNNSPGSWISVNFKNYKIKPTCYTIRHDNEVGYYLRSWTLQGSNDAGLSWINLDVRVNNSAINSADGWGSFSLSANTFYQTLRILSTGADSSGSYYFCCGEIEFYGEIAVV